MRENPQRRAALVDAAIEVLAREGARGLTFRAVDAEAGVPTGTASNYFSNRDDLLTQAGGRVYERLYTGAADTAESMTGPRDRDMLIWLMRDVVSRVTEFRSGYLALLELRLEATRRPGLREVLTRTIRADLDNNINFQLKSGLPGDTTTVVLLYMALNWLIVERLTLPDVLGEDRLPDLITEAVHRSLPPEPAAGQASSG
jgi:DNA-binding transcriptional regulator YbjK